MSNCAVNPDGWCHNHYSVCDPAEDVCDYARDKTAETEVKRLTSLLNEYDEALPQLARLTERAENAEKVVNNVMKLRDKWNDDLIASLGKPLPGGVLNVPVQHVVNRLDRALGDKE